MKKYVCDNCKKDIEEKDNDATITIQSLAPIKNEELLLKQPAQVINHSQVINHFCGVCTDYLAKSNWTYVDERRK